MFLLTVTSLLGTPLGTPLWSLFYSEYQLDLLSHGPLLPLSQSLSHGESFVVQPHTTEPGQAHETAWFSKSLFLYHRYILSQNPVTEGGLDHTNFTYAHTHGFWYYVELILNQRNRESKEFTSLLDPDRDWTSWHT